ncbi:MAG: transcriptional repressor LexA [Candidatus Shapirobacteria bacterium]
MKKPLTSKQKTVLSLIKDQVSKNGVMPTLEELRVLLGLSSVSSVQRHTDALKEKGYLKNARGLSLPDSSDKVQIPLVGNVACGVPFLATENVEAYISYDASKIGGSPNDYFFLRAVGDSMNATRVSGKAIDDGDFVLVQKQQTADSGSRVVVLVGDEATIKKIIPEDGYVRLQPESTNPKNKPIILLENFSVQGVAIDVIKKGNK